MNLETLEGSKIKLWILAFILVVLCSLNFTDAEAQEQDLRELLTSEFRDRLIYLTVTNEEGEIEVQPYTTVFGRLQRDFKAPFITESLFAPGAGILDIPTVGLTGEHWNLSFEVLMKAQREYADCVGRINENLLRLGQTCMLDQPCHPLYETVMVIREYWVPSFPVEDNYREGPPSRLDYAAHFEAGIASVNLAVYNVGLCEITLGQIRGIQK